MGRNYFSRPGGPCYRNNGFSGHEHDHKPGSSHEDIKPDYKAFFIRIGIVVLLFVSYVVAVVL